MARSNKYASINFNEIYGPKKPSSSHSTHPHQSSQNTPLPAARTHGRMLVLTRPSNPQPQPPPTTPPPPSPPPKPADLTRPESDSISLRPLGCTDSSSSSSNIPIKEEKQSPSLTFPKPEPFVPPHLRPGFVGREERLVQDGQKEKQGFRPRDRSHPFVQGQHVREHSPPRRGGAEDGRPRSGGYEGMQRGGSDLERNRPSSGGNRPSFSGWNGSYRSPHF
ncbi:uncharacterized protein LOC131245289 [Magnolia sinica]|uniref:uncharacterized protein LOC131245289 n=1 Tax=Magnolia sinica TaxID=86752 RepID=UPI002658BB4B|nr:uncharacterized protein LOC131245289 [Magnolia sinica]